MVDREGDRIVFTEPEQLEFGVPPTATLRTARNISDRLQITADGLKECVDADKYNYKQGAKDERDAWMFRARRLHKLSKSTLELLNIDQSKVTQ